MILLQNCEIFSPDYLGKKDILIGGKGLKQDGVSAWILTGAYQIPTPTIVVGNYRFQV